MWDLIKPPTDNLYKFAATFGLVLFVVGFVVPPWVFYRSSLEYLKSLAGEDELAAYKKYADERNKIFEERRKKVEAEQVRLQQRRDNLAKSPRSASVSSEIEKVEAAIKDVNKQVETLEDTAHEFKLNVELKTAQAKQHHTFSTNESRNSRVLVVVGWFIIAPVGLIVAAVGFRELYRRVQVFEDLILVMRATSITASADAAGESGNPTATPDPAE